MLVVPFEIPVTIPDDGSIVPTALLVLDHEPPVFGSANVVVLPEHTLTDPVIAPGVWFTVTTAGS